MEKILKQAKGINGQLELLEDRIRITRKGVTSFLIFPFRGEKEIFIKDISSIHFKKAGLMTNGFIQFSFFGGTEAKGGLFQATREENTIMFRKSQQKVFEEIKEMVEEKTKEPKEKTGSNLEDLGKLASLKEKGIITKEEFQKKKKEILGL